MPPLSVYYELSAKAGLPLPSETIQMYLLKFIGLTLFQLVKQVVLLPQNIAAALRQRRRQSERDEFEAERLDRLRNPSKYQGR